MSRGFSCLGDNDALALGFEVRIRGSRLFKSEKFHSKLQVFLGFKTSGDDC